MTINPEILNSRTSRKQKEAMDVTNAMQLKEIRLSVGLAIGCQPIHFIPCTHDTTADPHWALTI